jgi:hypothetical protein
MNMDEERRQVIHVDGPEWRLLAGRLQPNRVPLLEIVSSRTCAPGRGACYMEKRCALFAVPGRFDCKMKTGRCAATPMCRLRRAAGRWGPRQK